MNNRLASLDALRGFDMLFITGLGSLITAICALFPGGTDCFLAGQMKHVVWNGLHHFDTIFPLFLFIAGVAFPYSCAKQLSCGASKREIRLKVVRRTLILVLLGLVCNGALKLDWASLRFYSVLGRIGLAWMVAALLYMDTKAVTRAIIAAVLLIGYNLLCLIPAPDVPGADPLSYEGCLSGYVDRCLFGTAHIYNGGCCDPEGILGLIPAVVTAMLGVFTGEYVRNSRAAGGRKCLVMFSAAAVMLAVGLVWNGWFPINKKLWTSSFVLVVGAYSLAMFALFHYVIDVRGWGVHKDTGRDWTLFFRVVGMNSITIYLLPRIIDFRFAVNFLFGGVIGLLPEGVGKVVFWTAFISLEWLLLYFLYRKKIFLKV